MKQKEILRKTKMKENAVKKKENSIAFVLGKLIESTGLELPAFCREINISYSSIYQLVHGINLTPNFATLLPIVKYFDITLEQLIGEEPLHINHKKRKTQATEDDEGKDTVWKSALYQQCVDSVSKMISKKDEKIGINRFSMVVKEVYMYSLKKNLKNPDKNFVEWYCKHHLGY